MLYTIGTTAEVQTLPKHLPDRLVTEIFEGLVILDAEYGSTRDYLQIGGYSIVAETEEDISQLIPILDIRSRFPEWATWIGNSGFISMLYIFNNDFSIMVYIPATIMPDIVRKELEE